MTVSIKVSAVRKALNEALGNMDVKMSRGSFEYDKDTGKVSFGFDVPKVSGTATTAASDTGDVVKDKFLNTVAKLELDKKVRRWYNRNIIDVNGDKWLVTAISNKGDKFTLSPKDGEGRNKRVDFADLETVIAGGRTARIDLGTKPKGHATPSTPTSTGGSQDVETLLDALDAKQVAELYEVCLSKELVKPVKRNNMKSRKAALLESHKLTGRGSVMTYLKKFANGDTPAATPASSSKVKSVLTTKQKRKLELTLKPSFNADRKRFAKAVNSKFKRVAFLTEYSVRGEVRVIVGFLVEEEKVRVYDPANGKFRKVDATVVIRQLSK